MKKNYFYLLFAAAFLAACSSSVEEIAGETPQVETQTLVQTVEQTGLQTIPLVVNAGTTSVDVAYTSGGAQKTMSVPFVSTSKSQTQESGYIQLFSETPTVVDITAGEQTLAENVQLTGRVLSAKKASAAQSSEEEVRKAYFYLRVADEIPTNGVPQLYYPYVSGGDGVHDDRNLGYIRTDLSAYGIEYGHLNDNCQNYIYSSDGSATAATIVVEPDIEKMLEGSVINYDPETQKVIWYITKQHKWHSQYATAGTGGDWHVDGVLVPKETTDLENLSGLPTGAVNTKIARPTQPDNVEKTADGVYHNGGVMLLETGTDNDYNDLVVDFDAEARFPKDGNFPYIKLIMHVRALSDTNVDKVEWNLSDELLDYVCPADDMHITIDGVNIEHTPIQMLPKETEIKDFRGIGIEAGDINMQGASAGNLQWLRTGDNVQGYFPKDENGNYNVEQASFSNKPFATVELMYYPKEDATEQDIEQAIANLISTAAQRFKFYDNAGQELSGTDYIIAPVSTPHPTEGTAIEEAFPLYNTGADAEWWTRDNADADKVIDIEKGY